MLRPVVDGGSSVLVLDLAAQRWVSLKRTGEIKSTTSLYWLRQGNKNITSVDQRAQIEDY